MADPSNEATGIQVFLRIRPPNRDGDPSHYKRDDINLNLITFDLPKKNADETVNNARSCYSFEFGGGIIDERCTQREIFKTVGIPSIDNALAGYNSTIFAYGQTGSGKTFTITGGPERYGDRGIIPRSIAYLFKSIQSDEAQFEYKCFVSYLEIYNQSGYDLLTQKTQSASSFNSDSIPKVQMLEDEDGNFHFKNLSVSPVQSEEEALNLLFRGDTNRAIASTQLNQNSTRSHCIFCIMIEKRCVSEDTVVRSKLNIVDLAGSERVSRSNSAGTTLEEAKYINSSLFFLEMVIVALHERETKGKKDVHIPYRNSMMTSVLRDSLGGNCKTVMIATISPEAQHTDESISTCHFAQRVALVRNKATVNEQIEPELVIKRLKAEVRRLRDEVAFLSKNEDDSSHDGEDGESALPSRHKEELESAIRRYVADRDESSQLDFCGEITLPKIRTVCAVFKSMLNSSSSQRLPVEGGDESEESDESESDGYTPTARLSSVAQKQYETTMRSNRRLEPNRQPATSIGAERLIQNERKPTRSKKVTLYGVPACRDEHVLEDPNSAFAWFKARYPSNQTIERNKAALKSRYDEAKSAGKQIEEIRMRIGKHKCAIDKVRQRCAVNTAPSLEEEKDEDYEISPEERRLLDLIDREKVMYKATLDSLRGLKGTIEESQRIVEKGRLRLQSDFDKWYQLMCNKMKGKPADRKHPSTTHSCSTEGVTHAEQSHPPPSASNSIQSPEPVTQGDEDFKLPPGIQLTGNKEADEDIIAFYKAKEILLCRRKEGR